MVAPLIAAAGIGAVGSVIGGLTGGKGARKAADIQQKTAREQIAALERNQQLVTSLEQPTMDRGNWAGGITADFLGKGDGAASAAALDTYRGSTGYKDLLKEGLGAVNSNAYARGMGDSGATLKALQNRGMSIADRSASDWLGRLTPLIGAGQQAIGNVAGVATNTTNNINAANQNAANASSNATLVSAANWQKSLQDIFNLGSSALGSSFGGGGKSAAPTMPYYPAGGLQGWGY